MTNAPRARAQDILLDGGFRGIFPKGQQGLGPIFFMQTASVTVSGSGADNAMVGLVVVPIKARVRALIVTVTTGVSGALAPTVGYSGDSDAFVTLEGTPLNNAATGTYVFTADDFDVDEEVPAGTALTVAHNQVAAGAVRFTVVLEGIA